MITFNYDNKQNSENGPTYASKILYICILYYSWSFFFFFGCSFSVWLSNLGWGTAELAKTVSIPLKEKWKIGMRGADIGHLITKSFRNIF